MIVGQFEDKHFVNENWPTIKFTDDERIALRYNFKTFKIESYDLPSFLKQREFEVGIIDSFQLAPNNSWEEFTMACFSLEKTRGYERSEGQL